MTKSTDSSKNSGAKAKLKQSTNSKTASKPKKSIKATKTNAAKPKTLMEKMKIEAANEIGIKLKNGDNGHLTARQAGAIGGQMVKKMIKSYKNSLK